LVRHTKSTCVNPRRTP